MPEGMGKSQGWPFPKLAAEGNGSQPSNPVLLGADYEIGPFRLDTKTPTGKVGVIC